MTLDIIQKIVVDTYAEGIFSHITSMEEAETAGDTLLLFLMRELGYTQDCQTIPEAIRRVDAAIEDLNEVRNALFDSRPREKRMTSQEGVYE